MADNNAWVIDEAHLLSAVNLAKIRAALEQDYIIVEHLHLAGGSSKDTLLFGDFDTFREYLTATAKPGDLFYIYALHDLYKKKLYLVRAKYPDPQGRTPTGGPY
jgi:uncharacterized SAM-dependent methyltransferase